MILTPKNFFIAAEVVSLPVRKSAGTIRPDDPKFEEGEEEGTKMVDLKRFQRFQLQIRPLKGKLLLKNGNVDLLQQLTTIL